MAVVDVLGVLVVSLSFAVTQSGIAELLSLLKSTSLSIDRVGVEGSGGLGRPVMLALAAAGYDVREVQANRTADRRKRRRRAKTDVEDAEPSPGRPSPTRRCRQPAKMPPRHLHPTNSTCCETGANRLCCNVSGC